VIHGKIELPEYSVEKVYFQSAPGLFVTGNLYRPANVKGKVPAVLFAHGHWQNARLSTASRSQAEGAFEVDVTISPERVTYRTSSKRELTPA
jgi:cephalosporin-C deacetylase-like acetyl esterase